MDLGHVAAELAVGAAVTLLTAGGLRVSAPATLRLPGHALDVRLTGTDAGHGGWTYGVSGGDGGSLTPLPGLALSPDVTGSLTLSCGIVRYTVHGRTARPWSPLPGVSVAGPVEFSDLIPNDRVVPAPAISGATRGRPSTAPTPSPAACTASSPGRCIPLGSATLSGDEADAIEKVATSIDELAAHGKTIEAPDPD